MSLAHPEFLVRPASLRPASLAPFHQGQKRLSMACGVVQFRAEGVDVEAGRVEL